MTDKKTIPQKGQRGLLLVLSSPSGAGKTTLSRMLVERCPLHISISVTTRLPRGTEKDGIEYHFRSKEEFERLVKADQLIEWAIVHENYYGTLRQTVENALNKGEDLLFDIDPQGMHQLKKKMPNDVVSIFILPPSKEELKKRLYTRAEDAENVIEMRLENAKHEIEQWPAYDYVIVNDDRTKAFEAIRTIYEAEKLKRTRCLYLNDFVKEFSDQ